MEKTNDCSSATPLELFNRRYEEELAVKDAEEERRKDQLRQQAKDDLQRWYDERQIHMEQRRDRMKNEDDLHLQKASKQSDKRLCDWDKVMRLVEFSKSKRDLNRMKTSIINAKQDRDSHPSEISK